MKSKISVLQFFNDYLYFLVIYFTMSDNSRLLTLIHKMRAYFRVSSKDEIIGLNITKTDLNKAVSPNNVIVGDGVSKIIVSATPPVSPQQGDIWIDIS